MKITSLIILLAFAEISSLHAQVINVASARSMSVGTIVTVRGIVLNGAEFGQSLRYVQDTTAGIACYASLLSDLVRGDSVQVTGSISEYNNLTEIIATSYTLISSNNALPLPKLLTPATAYQELYEGQLVQVDSVYFIGNSMDFMNSNNYDITDGQDTSQIRIPSNSNLNGTVIPSSFVNVIGVMGQYQTTYQLLPRDILDIEYYGNYPVVITPLSQSNTDTTSFTVLFTTLHPGNTMIRYGTTPAMTGLVTDMTSSTAHSLDLIGLTPGTVYYVQGVSISNTNDTSVSAIQFMMSAPLNPLPCDATLWSHVYNPSRLLVNIPCMTITGVIDHLIYEADGDIHIRLQLDPAYEFMLNAGNMNDQFGKLVCEPVCVTAVTQASAEAACVDFVNTVYIPNIGEHVMVTGPFVTDNYHGWNEIHPVSAISITTSTPSQTLDTAVVNHMRVFPNPAVSLVNFRFSQLPSSPLYINIMDVLGRNMGQYQNLSSHNFQLNCKSFPNGIYYYNISQHGHVLRSGQFVVNHTDAKSE